MILNRWRDFYSDAAMMYKANGHNLCKKYADVMVKNESLNELVKSFMESNPLDGADLFIELRESLICCDICGDVHDINSVPLSCETGDGE